jgi:methionine--tRNA ligase beta chain
MIHIDEFRKLELRVGVVKSAEAHPNADKLLVLKVDLGSEERQIVAGIRAHYQPEELVGKQVVVVANLETATLRGLESQGMVLAASSDDGRVVVLTPEKTVNAGAKVS